jgi:hypothetical protein
MEHIDGAPLPQESGSAQAPDSASASLHRYRIRVKGALDASWSEWFEGLTITSESNGETTLAGPLADQSALLGVLVKVHNLNLPLVSVQQIEADAPSGTDQRSEE